MPELPEVETIRQELSPHVVGRKITGLNLEWEGIIRQPEAEEFRERLLGQRIEGLSRWGKYLIFGLDSDDFLVIHLRMSGSLLISHDSAEAPKYTRATIHLDGDKSVFFRDPRKFGRMWLIRDIRDVTRKLGPEPLTSEFTREVLGQRLAKRKAPIKAVLLDQSVIAGIGNMYADETLFAAGIHPERSTVSLTAKEIKRLHGAIREILAAAIKSKGASVENYFRPGGETGTAHFYFKVAHRLGGDFCPVCGTLIERITIRNRGTYFCPRCQK